MKLYVRLPDQIITTCVLLLSFSKNGLRLEKCQYISDNNINNLNLLINVSKSIETFSIGKKQEISFITTLNEGITSHITKT